MILKSMVAILISLLLLGSLHAHEIGPKRYLHPWQEKELILARHKQKIGGAKGSYTLSFSCQEQSISIKDCPRFQYWRTFYAHPSKKQTRESLGVADRKFLPMILHVLIAKYDDQYNPSPLYITAASGFLLGAALGNIYLAFGLGATGVVVDLLKLPLALPYTLVNKIHRQVQKKRLQKRFLALVQGKKFRPTNILGNNQFHDMANNVLDLCEILNQSH